MIRLVSIFTIVLSIVLFPPAVAAFISQNALPGETLYSVKRQLENGALLLASVHPVSRAWFGVVYSQRRFYESTSLIARGDSTQARQSLEELVSQTNQAASEIQNIQALALRQNLAQRLSSSINEYNKGLEIVKQQITPTSPTTQSRPSPSPESSRDSENTQDTHESTDLERELEEAQKELEEIQKELDRIQSKEQTDQEPDLGSLFLEIERVDLEGFGFTLEQSINLYEKALP